MLRMRMMAVTSRYDNSVAPLEDDVLGGIGPGDNLLVIDRDLLLPAMLLSDYGDPSSVRPFGEPSGHGDGLDEGCFA